MRRTRRELLAGTAAFAAWVALPKKADAVSLKLDTGRPLLAPNLPTYFANTGALSPINGASNPPAIYVSSTNTSWFAWTSADPNKTFGDGWVTHVRTYNHSTKVWSPIYVIGQAGTTGNDPHMYPALFADGNGYVHCIMGHTPPLHYCTVNANDPSAWVGQTIIGGTSYVGLYPVPVVIGSSVYLFFGQQGSSPTNISLIIGTISSGGAISWGSSKQLVNFTTSTTLTYMSNAVVDGNGNINFGAISGPSASTTRNNIYYFIYVVSTGAVENISGSTSTIAANLPIGGATAAADYELVSQPSYSGDIPQIAIDSSGNIYIIYMDGASFSTVNYKGGYCELMYLSYIAGSLSSPVALIAQTTYGNGYCLVVRSAGVVDLYFTQYNSQAYSGETGYGGDIQTLRLSGGTWGPVTTVEYGGSVYGQYSPSVIPSGNANARAVWCQTSFYYDGTYAPPFAALTVTAYGDNGFLKAPLPTLILPAALFSLFYSSSNFTLSTNNLKVTNTGAAGSAMSTYGASASNQNVYAEFICNHFTNTLGVGACGNGFSTASTRLGTDAGGNSIALYIDTGNVARGNSVIATIFTAGANDNIGIAVSMQYGLVWFRKNGGEWNNDVLANQNPAAGTGGYSISGFSGSVFTFLGIAALRSNDAFTAQFAAASWTYSAPSGYSAITPSVGSA